MKAQCRKAFAAACRADPAGAGLYRKWWADVLAMSEGETPAVQAELYRRTRILFEVMADKKSWPQSVAAFVERHAAHP